MMHTHVHVLHGIYVNQRTCKHTVAIRGIDNEKTRITNNKGTWTYKPAVSQPSNKQKKISFY